MRRKGEADGCAVIFFSFMFLIGGIMLGYSLGMDDAKANAIHHGVAKWTINEKNGLRSFVYVNKCDGDTETDTVHDSRRAEANTAGAIED